MPDPFMPDHADSFTTFRSPGATMTSAGGTGGASSYGALFGGGVGLAPPPLRHSYVGGSSSGPDGGLVVKSEVGGVDHAAEASPFSATPSPLVSNDAMMQPLTINPNNNTNNGLANGVCPLGSGGPPSQTQFSASGNGSGLMGVFNGGGNQPALDPAMPTLSPHPPILKKESDVSSAR